jgi:hypothetical protein
LASAPTVQPLLASKRFSAAADQEASRPERPEDQDAARRVDQLRRPEGRGAVQVKYIIGRRGTL